MNAFRFPSSLACMLALSLSALFAAETRPATPAEPLIHRDSDAGYSVQVPKEFTRLTDDQNREVFKGISEHFGKQGGERALRRPPVWFRGPIDPRKPAELPAALAIGYTDAVGLIDPAQKDKYKEMLEQQFRKYGERYGDLGVKIVKVDGLDALHVTGEFINTLDTSRHSIVNVLVANGERRYEIVFNYSREQQELINSALATILSTFKVETRPVLDAQAQSKWTRIALWTGGCFVGGLLLSLLLRILSGVGEKAPEQSGDTI